MTEDTIDRLLRDMRDTAKYRWQGYDDVPGMGYHDDALIDFADRLKALLKDAPR